jgi:hypothetical protein
MICHSDSLEEKSIHCQIGAVFILVEILTLCGFGFRISFLLTENSFQEVVTTFNTIS